MLRDIIEIQVISYCVTMLVLKIQLLFQNCDINQFKLNIYIASSGHKNIYNDICWPGCGLVSKMMMNKQTFTQHICFLLICLNRQAQTGG